jgi:hypothetical protein
VTLTTSTLAEETIYTLTISNIKDSKGNTIAANTTADIKFYPVAFEYYEGSWETMPDFSALSPKSSGMTGKLGLDDVSHSGDNFAVRFHCRIEITKAGQYTFYTTSDDGSKLYIDGSLIVDNDGVHAAEEKSGQVELTAGKHDFVLEYLEVAGGEVLSASWSGPEINKQLIPESVLFRGGTATIAGVRPLIGKTSRPAIVGARGSVKISLSMPGIRAIEVFRINGRRAQRIDAIRADKCRLEISGSGIHILRISGKKEKSVAHVVNPY